MLWLDGLFRFSGITLLILLAVLLLRDGRTWASKSFLALACISVAALFVGYAPPTLIPPEPIYTIARLLDIPHLVFVWLFALSLYESRFRLRAYHILAGALYCAPILWIRLQGHLDILPMLPSWIFIYGSLTSMALMGHLCYVTVKGRADDLLEARRTSRFYFVFVIIFVAVTAAIIDPLPDQVGGFDRRTLKIMSIWPAIAWAAYWLLAFNLRSAYFGSHSGSGRTLENRDEVLIGKLKTLIQNDEVFRETGLTIGSLAGRVGVSQHKLRAMINQHLGYANFSEYLNTFRIEAVKKAFENAETGHLPILTISMDCGFNSLSTFNKAFKSMEGITPSAYRKGFKT